MLRSKDTGSCRAHRTGDTGLQTQGPARKTQGGASAGRENRASPFSPSSGCDARDSRGRELLRIRQVGGAVPHRAGRPATGPGGSGSRVVSTGTALRARARRRLLRPTDTCSGLETHAPIQRHMPETHARGERHMLRSRDTCWIHMLRPEDTGSCRAHRTQGPARKTQSGASAVPGFRCRATPTPRIGGHELLRIRPFCRSTEPGECVEVGVSRLRDFGCLVTTGRRRRRPRRCGAARSVEPGRYRSDCRRPASSRASFLSSGQDSTSAL